MVFADGADIYRALGVSPAITASGSTTAFGGNKLREEVVDTMNKASRTMVNLDALNAAAEECPRPEYRNAAARRPRLSA